MPHRLVWAYTCQNTTLLEITCHGSYIFWRICGYLRKWCISCMQSLLVLTLFQVDYDMWLYHIRVILLVWQLLNWNLQFCHPVTSLPETYPTTSKSGRSRLADSPDHYKLQSFSVLPPCLLVSPCACWLFPCLKGNNKVNWQSWKPHDHSIFFYFVRPLQVLYLVGYQYMYNLALSRENLFSVG